MTAPHQTGSSRRLAAAAAIVLTVIVGLVATTARAQAASPRPAWLLDAVSDPTNLVPGSDFTSGSSSYIVRGTNVGGATVDSAYTVTVTLPRQVTPDPNPSVAPGFDAGGSPTCSTSGQQVICTDDPGANPSDSVRPGGQFVMRVPVAVDASAAGTASASVAITGGGAADQRASATATVSSTPAPFGFNVMRVSTLNADGTPDTQAGSHPFSVIADLGLNTYSDPTFGGHGFTVPSGGDARQIAVHLPPGLIGTPTTIPRCPESGYVTGTCPPDTQVGTAAVTFLLSSPALQTVPVYNVTPPPGVPAEFAFTVVQVHAQVKFTARTGSDYGLDATVSGINSGGPLIATALDLWGDPASPLHDGSRRRTSQDTTPASSDAPEVGFISNATRCGVAQAASAQVDSWQNRTTEVDSSPATLPPLTGCDALSFAPSITAAPDTAAANSPSGLSLDLHVPQTTSPDQLATAEPKDITLGLPAGMRVSPSAANRLQSCSVAQFPLGDASASTCPDASKIGTAEIDSPVLPDPVTGSLYLAQQDANPFGSLLAVYLDASADGFRVKLAGKVTADPVTGQLTISFTDTPQLPYSDVKVDLFGGPNAPLSSPSTCGSTSVSTALDSWGGQTAAPTSAPLAFTSNCTTGFAPAFTAGAVAPKAGRPSRLTLSFSRLDTDQPFQGLTATLPVGLLAKITGVGECTDAQLASISTAPGTGAAQAAAPSCPASSQVGVVSVAAGPGSDPYPLTGHAYLTGPYKGAPYGLAVVVPAVAGPIDLGTVVVRQALNIDPTTAQVTITSDPFPTILDGIPLQIRSVSVDLNRTDFTVNPTSCAKNMAITATLSSAGGAQSNQRSPFAVGSCSKLKFSPRLALSVSGRGQTRPGTRPRLTATVTQPSGQANLRSVKVTLPRSLALDVNNSSHVCSTAAAAKIACPTSTIVGTATADARILPHPLTGSVYLVQGIRHDKNGRAHKTEPALLVPLRGADNVAINLRGQSSVNKANDLVAAFATIPDAAISKFTLTINGGRKGIIDVTGTKSICTGNQNAHMNAVAHSDARHYTSPTLQRTACPAPKKH